MRLTPQKESGKASFLFMNSFIMFAPPSNLKIKISRDLRNNSVVKSSGCFSGRQGLNSQHLHGGCQWHHHPSFGLCGHCRQNTHLAYILKNTLKFKRLGMMVCPCSVSYSEESWGRRTAGTSMLNLGLASQWDLLQRSPWEGKGNAALSFCTFFISLESEIAF